MAQRVPRAPLASHVVAGIPAAPQDSFVFVDPSETKLLPGDMNVESGTEYVASGHVTKRYVRRELRSSSTRINSSEDDFHQSQDTDQTQLVDLVLLRW